MNVTKRIKQKALEIGFDLVGITTAGSAAGEHLEAFNKWLDDCCSPNLQYLKNNLDKRFDPAKILPNAKSVIVTALNYKPAAISKPRTHSPPSAGLIASYARYEDYHTFIKKLLRRLTDFITTLADTKLRFKICVDSKPIAEKALATRAGLGFIGKNHLLINPSLGPQLLLGEIVTDLELIPDEPIKSGCGRCTKCIDACPTAALRPDGFFDAGRCISYLTIEHNCDIEIPTELAALLDNHLFGCDDCILACPYQHNAPACKNTEYKYFPDRAELDLNEILNMTQDTFEKRFSDSPILRTSLNHLKKTAQLCLANLSKSSPRYSK